MTRFKQILAVILLSACIALVGCGGGGGGGSKKKSSQHQNQTPNGSQNNQGSQDDSNDNAAGDHSSDDDSQQHNHGTPDPGDDNGNGNGDGNGDGNGNGNPPHTPLDPDMLQPVGGDDPNPENHDPAHTAANPEPATIALGAVGAAFLLTRRYRRQA